jgi:hypothetical protein
MDTKHLEDFLDRSDKLGIKTGDIISEYTRLAINYSANGFSPTVDDYELAYETIKEMDKYKIN